LAPSFLLIVKHNLDALRTMPCVYTLLGYIHHVNVPSSFRILCAYDYS